MDINSNENNFFLNDLFNMDDESLNSQKSFTNLQSSNDRSTCISSQHNMFDDYNSNAPAIEMSNNYENNYENAQLKELLTEWKLQTVYQTCLGKQN